MGKYKVKELIHYIFTLNNIRFCIYTIYFIFMIIYSVKYLESDTNNELNAILQSFLTYLAFDNIIINTKNISLSPVEFLKKMINTIISDEEINELKK